MKESGTLIQIYLDFKNAFNSAGHSCLWAILRGLGVPDVKFLEELYSKLWMKIQVGTGCSAPIQLDTGTVQGSVLSLLLFDLFLNALLRLLDATGITHGIKRTPQWNNAAYADDLSIYACTVRDANKLLDVIHRFEFWSGLWISIPKSLATGAMYGTKGGERGHQHWPFGSQRTRLLCSDGLSYSLPTHIILHQFIRMKQTEAKEKETRSIEERG